MSNNDDFQIELGQPLRRHIEHKVSPLRDPACCALPYDEPKSDKMAIFIAENVMRRIEALAARDKEREVGGVLLGGFFRSGDSAFLLVDDFIEAKAARGTDVSLTFTHETWEQITAEQAERGGNSVIVGWYHSHPALGVFMSREDEFIHTSFFTDPWHVAIVVDPIYHNWGAFTWKDGSLERAGGFYVYADKKSTRRVKQYVKELNAERKPAGRDSSAAADRQIAARRRSTTPLWAIIVALLLAQAVTAYFLFSGRDRGPTKTDYMARAIELLSVSDLTGGEQFLRMELAAHPGNSRAQRELERLGAILKAPGVTQTDGRQFDRTNFLLATVDKACREKTDYRAASGDFDFGLGISAKTNDEYSAQLATEDPKQHALELYEEAEPTQQARLERAKSIRDAARSGKRSAGTTWYYKAARWLDREHVRRIAYGRSLGIAKYDEPYKKLSTRDKKLVKEMCARLLQ